MGIREKIIAVRTKLKLTQDGLAKAVGVTRQAVSRWENGTAEPDLRNLQAVSSLIGLSLDRFLLLENFDELEIPVREAIPSSGSKTTADSEPKEEGEEDFDGVEVITLENQSSESQKNNIRRIADIKCAMIIIFYFVMICAVAVALAAFLIYILRGAIAEELEFWDEPADATAARLPTFFIMLTSASSAVASFFMLKHVRTGANNPIIGICAVAAVDIFAIISGVMLSANIAGEASSTMAAIKWLYILNIYFVIMVAAFNFACALYFLDSIEKTPYVPLPLNENEKYIPAAFAAGAFMGFLGTPVMWATGFIMRKELKGRIPVFIDRFTRALVGGALGEVTVIVLLLVFRYVAKSF